MFTRKTKPVPQPISRHSFRMKAVGTEFEAHGLGLIVAFVAVVLIIAVVAVGAVTATGRLMNFAGASQSAPAPLERPPAST